MSDQKPQGFFNEAQGIPRRLEHSQKPPWYSIAANKSLLLYLRSSIGVGNRIPLVFSSSLQRCCFINETISLWKVSQSLNFSLQLDSFNFNTRDIYFSLSAILSKRCLHTNSYPPRLKMAASSSSRPLSKISFLQGISEISSPRHFRNS